MNTTIQMFGVGKIFFFFFFFLNVAYGPQGCIYLIENIVKQKKLYCEIYL